MHACIFLVGTTAFSYGFFGQGSGPIHRRNLQCSGTELRLVDCTFSGGNCEHYEDAGVRCLLPTGKLV